jgi:thiosulfate dehydrogenase
MRCHGVNGEGVILPDSSAYTYPPLWKNSYNISAGMYTLSKLAGFIKNNMPYGDANWQNPVLTSEEAWDVAAFVNSQPRPEKLFKADWPDISKKPFDYPFGPYKDSFTVAQHKYGPFEPIIKRKGSNK